LRDCSYIRESRATKKLGSTAGKPGMPQGAKKMPPRVAEWGAATCVQAKVGARTVAAKAVSVEAVEYQIHGQDSGRSPSEAA
jgi:hypothetical protein